LRELMLTQNALIKTGGPQDMFCEGPFNAE
jgi:hypothetical protein